MKSYDAIGYVHLSDTYCDGCGARLMPGPDDPEWYPIFADSEWDYIPACNECGWPIEDVSLTSEGLAYTRAALLGDWNGEPDHRDAWVRCFDANGGSLTRYGYGIGSSGCLYDSVSGPYDTEAEAIEALRETMSPTDDEPTGWTEVGPGYWNGPGIQTAEVFSSDEPGDDWGE